VNRFVLVLLSIVALQGCSATLRDVQSATNVYNVYEGSSVKEEVVWKIRSIYGQ
jgi:uncharacterized protein YceK